MWSTANLLLKFRLFSRRVYFGPPRAVRINYYDCPEGLDHLLIGVTIDGRPLYTCEEGGEIILADGGSGAPIDNTEEPTGVENLPSETTDAPTQRPTTAAPTSSSGLMDCPRGGFHTNNYIYSSL